MLYSGPADAEPTLRDVVQSRLDVRRVEPSPAEVAAGLSEAVAFLDASMKVRIDAAMIAAAPSLRVISTATTGADHIDAEALRRRGIPLLTLRGHDVLRELTPAAEHSFLLLLACARRLRGAIAHVLDGRWERTEFPGTMLRGKTIGIVGCGRIGTWMARYATAFGMRVVGYDPHRADWPAEIAPLALDALLAQSDFVTLHVHLTPETRGLLSRERLGQMKPGSILVNTSRGDVIDEAALVEALESGRIAAAGLDVVQGEPEITGSPLFRYAVAHDNLVLTPHVGGFSPDAVRIVVAHAAAGILRELGL